MTVKYGTLENVQKAHEAALNYGAIAGYTFNPENEKFGLRHWGFGKDLVSARKTADILESMLTKVQNNEKPS